MDADIIPNRKIHHGHNVKRWREMLGIKQEILAKELNLSQQAISKLEAQEKIDDETLEKIAKELSVSAEAIKNFDEEKAINIVSNTFQDESFKGGVVTQYNPTFNPLDKVVELYDQIIKGKDEKIALLEQLLKEKR
ncbi:MAG: helix-turn-helix domain-containing protein [Candidatus Symbiothrix sp.]|nr:helix-turn-helix domain-containing protein [Candidatus Symbiothrix sp.]